jgi:hypothetical protein
MIGVVPRVRLLSFPVSLDKNDLWKATENWPEVRFAEIVLTFLMSFLSPKMGALLVSKLTSKHVKESLALPKKIN